MAYQKRKTKIEMENEKIWFESWAFFVSCLKLQAQVENLTFHLYFFFFFSFVNLVVHCHHRKFVRIDAIHIIYFCTKQPHSIEIIYIAKLLSPVVMVKLGIGNYIFFSSFFVTSVWLYNKEIIISTTIYTHIYTYKYIYI